VDPVGLHPPLSETVWVPNTLTSPRTTLAAEGKPLPKKQTLKTEKYLTAEQVLEDQQFPEENDRL
jgi:hypothetical protein